MKTVFLFTMFCCFWIHVFGQAPQKMSYQAVIRDTGGNLVTNHQVGMRITILEGTLPGTSVYQEIQTPTTNANGLVTIEIGGGTGFSTLNWGNSPHYIKTETDPEGGTAYMIAITSQLLSVPYALYAEKAGNGSLWSRNGSDIYYKNGNVGIGTTNPYSLFNPYLTIGDAMNNKAELMNLTAKPTGANFDLLRFYAFRKIGGTSWDDVSWRIQQRVDASDMGYIEFNSGTGQRDIAFGTNNIERLRITLDGKVVLANQNIKNLADPVDARDAATKAYVDMITDKLIKTGVFVADMDGNFYPVIKIGTQTWMAENLKTTKYNDGAAIPLVTDKTAWSILTTPGYCWYNNDQGTYGNTYGAFYNWYTVNTGKLCPVGWHVPSDAEWTTLTSFLGGETVAGGKMKEAGTNHWNDPNTGATDESGFSGLPGGDRYYNGGSFFDIGYYGLWWSSAERSTASAWARRLVYSSIDVNRISGDKEYGYSVRCVRDPL